ncbi:winged helix-turn-helix domain-containing protein [Micromonospora sp. WMMD998]|uniref:winged helix-turn-helix domain-containing protein n=1 Tax=Micromonospora sp. WMMD998 TaxID=3016092 RepID=UPI00249AD4AB|nr:winged helix-turn-helix domain-containing protein [Micromonospora sp. WMMD998]WFE39392.1 winged helix-turn-helix domain-containing protein [Micromonospora sp. WMMD998]
MGGPIRRVRIGAGNCRALRQPAGKWERMTAIPSLVIGIASSATERRQLAQLLGGTETFLIVSSAHQARRFLDLVRRPSVPPVSPVSPVPPVSPVSAASSVSSLSSASVSPVSAVPATSADVDAVAPVDAVLPVDVGLPVGAVSPVDAGSSVGAVSRVEVGSSVDAGLPVVAAAAPVDALLARSSVRGTAADVDAPVELPGLELAVDSDRRVLCWREREVGLTPLEHDLLVCLVGTPGRVWTYARLHRAVWGNDHLGRGSDMHSVVRRIRHKLGRLDAAATIHAVRGVGFRLTPA